MNQEIKVSTLNDENDGDFSLGDLSFREAIALASINEGADTITFDSALSGGTISLDSALSNELIIGDSVSIEGLGQDNLTLDGGFVFKLPGFNAELNIDGLNIVGGTVDSFGNLNITDTTISQSLAVNAPPSSIVSRGTLNLSDSNVIGSSDGGNLGISIESGTADIINSTIANHAGFLGGSGVLISTEETVNITNSTIANNSNRGAGGVINTGGGSVNIANTTIANNGGLAGGGILNTSGTVTLASSIVASNGGGIGAEGDVSGDGEFISNGNNLIGNGDDAEAFVDGVNGDIVGTNGDDPENPDDSGLVDPQLGQLQNNGGSTLTLALLDGSPAIDAGSNPNNLATDQRGEGFNRTVGNGTDIGAFELQSEGNGGGENFVVSTLDDENDGNFSQGDLSLREAIALASVTEGEDTISFDSSLEGGTIVFDESLNRELTISGGVIIDGLGQDNLTLDGGFIFKLAESDADLNIDGLNIVGGAIDSFGDLTLTNSTIAQSRGTLGSNSDNSSIISRQTLNISNSSIVDSSGGDNLGILIESGTANIENSTIANHEGVLGGSGVLILSDETVNISNSTIANNQNRFVGGVANAGGGEVNISNSTIANNNGGLGNGGIQNSSGTVTVTSTILAGNASAGIGDVAGNGEFISGGNNIVSNGDNATGFVDSDLVGTLNNPIDPQLGELQNNGGTTETIALLNNSPAIDAGSNPNNLTTDQRGEGFNRTVGQGTDVGAFEVQSTSTPTPETIEGTDGDDTLVGGAGDDKPDGMASLRIAGNGGNDAVFGGDGNDHIFGGLGRDTLVGGKGNDTLRGEEGNDILLGGEGHESLRGGDGDDLINGEGGNDVLHGDAGNDTLIGGGGRDTLEGGHGHDTFVLDASGEQDTITDFADGSDRLQLSGELKFDDLHIVNRESGSGVNIFQNNGDRSIVAVIENVHAADLDLHDFA